jgi:hypothetical protein
VKLLPCRTGRPCQSGYATTADGKPYVLGRRPVDMTRQGLLVHCALCKMAYRITAVEYNALPSLSLARLRELGMGHIFERDLRGAGVTDEQLDELVAAAVDPDSLTGREVWA